MKVISNSQMNLCAIALVVNAVVTLALADGLYNSTTKPKCIEKSTIFGCDKLYECKAIEGQSLNISDPDDDSNSSSVHCVFTDEDEHINSSSAVLHINHTFDKRTVGCSYRSMHSKCYKFEVQYAPIEIEIPWPRLQELGYPYNLTCPLKSNPPASYSWKKYPGEYDLSPDKEQELPSNLVFSENNRTWTVKEYDFSNDGIYICTATNHLGNKTFLSLKFQLNADLRCGGSKTINISPSGKLVYQENNLVILKCTAMPAYWSGERPNWYININGKQEYVKTTKFISQNASYSKEECKWTNILTITNFRRELEGNYTCGFSKYWKNQTISFGVADTKTIKIAISVPIVFIVLVVVVASITMITGRRCLQLSFKRLKEPPKNGFQYDIFISAHEEISSLVEENILKPLEEECPPYKVCWHKRDFIAGLPIAQQINDVIAKESRKVVFVFSENFLDSKFCKMEYQQAFDRLMKTHTRCLIPVATSETSVPTDLKKAVTCLPVVLTNETSFITKLKELIGDPLIDEDYEDSQSYYEDEETELDSLV